MGAAVIADEIVDPCVIGEIPGRRQGHLFGGSGIYLQRHCHVFAGVVDLYLVDVFVGNTVRVSHYQFQQAITIEIGGCEAGRLDSKRPQIDSPCAGER